MAGWSRFLMAVWFSTRRQDKETRTKTCETFFIAWKWLRFNKRVSFWRWFKRAKIKCQNMEALKIFASNNFKKVKGFAKLTIENRGSGSFDAENRLAPNYTWRQNIFFPRNEVSGISLFANHVWLAHWNTKKNLLTLQTKVHHPL